MRIIQAEYIMQHDPFHARLPHDEKFDHGSAFINGRYCSIGEAAIPITDCGFIHADAAYDVVSVSRGYFFRLQEHLDRIDSACDIFRLRNPYSQTETTDILTKLVTMAGTKDAYVWWCVTRGRMPTFSERGNPEAYENCFYAFVVPYYFIASDEQRTRGLDIMVSRDFIRIPPEAVDPTAKNFHWMDMKLSLFEATDSGRERSVLTDAEGYLTEGPGVNIFLIKDGVLFTPHSGCLEGITRKTTLALVQEMGLPQRVERVHANQLREADEAFFTSTAGGIMPINSVDGIVLGGESGPGKLVTQLHDHYWGKRWNGWLGTPIDYDAIQA